MELTKITDESIKNRRRYDDACGAAHALDLIGERWSLLVMRELMLGPKRFGDIKAGLPGISANILTQRLEALEAAGILTHTRLPPPHSVPVYELTPWGYEAEPILQVLGRWASRSPAHDPTLPFGAVSLLLSLRTMFAPARAGDMRAIIGLELDGETFTLRIRDGAFEAERGAAKTPDVVFVGAARMVAAAIYGGQALDTLEAAGALALRGDRAVAARFVTLFPLPPKAERPPV
ncbi:winged helix-turn-helix transcriptional regulator [Ancylobacter sp. WKF20]|uniref:winged helix-turn-helix transcriptional regulator n=1 Tax=Ancylobacter sp. WKF20 TaxID=3039801 RepID=UPI0024343545|nr:winged helix-turn-helix transcriptional regulator [Ancylobacter sp. WKF20]WGD29050.1 winged helix-turn-helix transcriptional regulator [Ancylobacter sp. WKF20]